MEYFNTNKFFMTALGHWPYRSQNLNRVQRILFLILVLSLDIPIMASLYATKDNFHKLILCIPVCLLCIDVFVAYIFFVVKTPDILFLLDKVSEHFKEIEPFEKEFFILKKTIEDGNFINIIYMIYISVAIVFFFAVTLTPQILDYFLPLNETRQKIYVIELEYIFFNRDNYYWFSFVQSFICGGLSIFILNTFDIMLYSFIQHACGMYRVLWFRLENCVNIKETTDEKMIHKNVVDCVLLHNKILQYVEKLDLCFTECLFITYGIVLLLLTFGGAMIVLNKGEMEILVKYIVFTVSHIIRLLYQCIPAQRLMDHSLIVNDNRYASDWYKMPVKILKTIFSYLSVLLSMTN
ncbi:uncharacterized protein LOC127286607 isoform X2 [Leptopilina boulardi]|uniref:uncharacterized protein LOC127286607 isoform X2 n=1 Tax=Leptopilina boulardi TaxID=63433 RepID=UPI0021F5C807|nr:uncharacterized protein LOC127286607 isoform X2 [Leptopilina boulardi]